MKKYHLFAGLRYYPSGGVGDYKLSSNDIGILHHFISGNDFDWWHIVDEDFKLIKEGNNNCFEDEYSAWGG